MVSNRTMWISTSNIFSRPCAVTDVMIGVGSDTLIDIILDVGVDMLTDELAVPIIEFVSVTDVGMLADENVNGLAVVMTPLEFTLSAPPEDPMPFC